MASFISPCYQIGSIIIIDVSQEFEISDGKLESCKKPLPEDILFYLLTILYIILFIN